MPWPEFQRLKKDLRLRKLAAHKYMASRSETSLKDMKYKYRSMEVRTSKALNLSHIATQICLFLNTRVQTQLRRQLSDHRGKRP